MNNEIKDIEYWKNNAKEDYIKTPISVLRYITELEKLTNQEQKLPIDLVSGWCSWHEHPKEGSEIQLMWSDNSINVVSYTKEQYNSLDFTVDLVPFKWRYTNR